ncbi:SIS domain-containing protein [Nakamurella endophytica]|uniref:Glutamine--fructose-6-phosphate aminotransferase [isomerizing] n=1 Tax=Nakamurella endophytica TaxID=1748367 RepID=A0A917SUT4_9ACTN|nr:hypothetical protein [Nakamurella endophytica]GGL97539.1 hypothetical protein GCM10011594_16710 [Nakamurella endophytica]
MTGPQTSRMAENAGPPPEHITFADARALQRTAIEKAVGTLPQRVREQQADGRFTGAGPVFLGIGASLAAACPAVWTLRSRGIHAWRLSAGDFPLPFPLSTHPLVAVSQGGRSAETLAALTSVPVGQRYAVVNADRSPIGDAAAHRLALGHFADSYASTIGFTVTVTGLGMLADAWDGGQVDSRWRELPRLLGDVERAAADLATAAAPLMADARCIDYVAGGASLGAAEAGALLCREVARIPATALSTRQYLHGAIESAAGAKVVLIGDDREADLAQTLAVSGIPVLLLTSRTPEVHANLRSITVPDVPPAMRTVLETVTLQAVAGMLAQTRGVEIEEFVFHSSDTKVTSAGVS